MTGPPLCAPPDPAPRKPRAAVPAGACDCHFHVFDGPSPQVPDRGYSAPPAPLSQYQSVQRALGLSRSVIVQPSIYGTDNRTTLQSLPADGSMKAVVVVDDDARVSDLQTLADQGAVGARANLLFPSGARLGALSGLCRSLAEVGWHLQILSDLSTWSDFAGFVAASPVPVVIDHMGHVPANKGVTDPGFQALLRALDSGRVWVKLSGAYRVTAYHRPGYDDVAPMARALIAANPDRMVWGSDWPHPSFTGPMPNDGDLLEQLFGWASPAQARRILVDNPAQLYGFDADV